MSWPKGGKGDGKGKSLGPSLEQLRKDNQRLEALIRKNMGQPPPKRNQPGQTSSRSRVEAPAKPKFMPDVFCKCCGKEGHQKSSCFHKNKACSICGKDGHLADVCRHRETATNTSTAGQKNEPKEKAAARTWLCPECLTENSDAHKQSCSKCKKGKPEVVKEHERSLKEKNLVQKEAAQKAQEINKEPFKDDCMGYTPTSLMESGRGHVPVLSDEEDNKLKKLIISISTLEEMNSKSSDLESMKKERDRLLKKQATPKEVTTAKDLKQLTAARDTALREKAEKLAVQKKRFWRKQKKKQKKQKS